MSSSANAQKGAIYALTVIAGPFSRDRTGYRLHMQGMFVHRRFLLLFRCFLRFEGSGGGTIGAARNRGALCARSIGDVRSNSCTSLVDTSGAAQRAKPARSSAVAIRSRSAERW
jgi:hypothetical protein